MEIERHVDKQGREQMKAIQAYERERRMDRGYGGISL